MVISLLARALRLASIASCLVAVAWFVSFAVEQTGTASSHQQAEINGTIAPGEASPHNAPAKKSGVDATIDSVFETLSKPFSGVTAGASSQWKIHIVDTLLALLLYGVGIGFIIRLLRLT